MGNRQKLELTWIGKESRPRLEPRILLEDPALSYHAGAHLTEGDLFDNRLIFGDNLLALKALEQEFTGQVKCVFIDPPYNTGSAFTHYDDGVEHSLWLSLMRDRLEILKRLLSPDGSLWITIDDNESHYLKVLCDEVFGRQAFIANIVWQKRTSRENRAAIGSAHDHLLLYAPGGYLAHNSGEPESVCEKGVVTAWLPTIRVKWHANPTLPASLTGGMLPHPEVNTSSNSRLWARFARVPHLDQVGSQHRVQVGMSFGESRSRRHPFYLLPIVPPAHECQSILRPGQGH